MKRLRILILYFIFLFLLVLAGECALGLVDPEAVLIKADDPQELYSFYPDRTGIASTPEYSVPVKIDQLGLRSCPELASSRKKSPRLFILGDSFAEGWGVSCADSFAGQLAGNFAVWNGGIHGGTVSYNILRHRHFKAKIPYDWLLIQLFDNDLDDLDKVAPYLEINAAGQLLGGRPDALLGWPTFSRFIKERSLYRMLRRAYYYLKGEPQPIKYYRPGRLPAQETLSHEQALSQFGPLRSIVDLKKSYNGQFLFYNPDAWKEEIWQNRSRRFQKHLAELTSEAHGQAKILLVYIPAKEVLAPRGIAGNLSANPGLAEIRAHNPFYQMLTTFVSRRVFLLDGQEVLREGAQDLYFPFDAHLNQAGHARLARAITEKIRLMSGP